MNAKEIMDITGANKIDNWEYFAHETALTNIEEDLQRDFEYYNKRLKSIYQSDNALDQKLTIVYQAHLDSIQRLLNMLNKQSESVTETQDQLSFFEKQN